MNPYNSPRTDSTVSDGSDAPRGFKRGLLNGWRYSRIWGLLLGTTAAIYAIPGFKTSDVNVDGIHYLRVVGLVAIYYAAVPVVWCLSAGIVATIQDLNKR
ncbi:MAG: hypothetical protein AAFU85_07700 [Planctomycetota bacterium]